MTLDTTWGVLFAVLIYLMVTHMMAYVRERDQMILTLGTVEYTPMQIVWICALDLSFPFVPFLVLFSWPRRGLSLSYSLVYALGVACLLSPPLVVVLVGTSNTPTQLFSPLGSLLIALTLNKDDEVAIRRFTLVWFIWFINLGASHTEVWLPYLPDVQNVLYIVLYGFGLGDDDLIINRLYPQSTGPLRLFHKAVAAPLDCILVPLYLCFLRRHRAVHSPHAHMWEVLLLASCTCKIYAETP